MSIKIALTSGEPAGIGPDLALIISQQSLPYPVFVLGCTDLLQTRAQLLKIPVKVIPVALDEVANITKPAKAQTLYVITHSLKAKVTPGLLNPANAPYVLALLDTAIAGCQSGLFDAIVTAPVQKSVINDAGITFSGHTEYLAQQTHTDQVVMMLASKAMKVALATTHLPLRAVADAIQTTSLEKTCQIVLKSLTHQFGIPKPRILVAGLNPHAGESGHLGEEDQTIIQPVIEKLQQQGHDFIGPLPADTLFTEKQLNEADAVIAMYHDQGLPVLKYQSFGEAANITLGLPIIRTSVDHGTALPLAGTGNIQHQSLAVAIDFAAKMVKAII